MKQKGLKLLVKQKDLKLLVKFGIAENITDKEWAELPPFDVLTVTHGANGMNGALLRNRLDGTLYAILARNSLLFACV